MSVRLCGGGVVGGSVAGAGGAWPGTETMGLGGILLMEQHVGASF